METTQPIPITTEDAREYRRFLAWRMYGQGFRQKDIADTLQVTQGAISQWIKRAQEQGVRSLQKRIAKGPEPRLTKEQLQQLPALLQKGAPAYGVSRRRLDTGAGRLGDQAGVWRFLQSRPHQ